jgi:hypothetical protein
MLPVNLNVAAPSGVTGPTTSSANSGGTAPFPVPADDFTKTALIAGVALVALVVVVSALKR